MAPLELCLLPPHAAPLPRGCPLLGFAAALVLLLTCLLPTAPPVAWALQTHVRLRPPPRPLPRAAAVHGRLQPPPPRVPPRPALRPLRWPPTPLLPGPRRAPGAATAAARASGPGPALVLAPLLALVSALLYYARSPHNTWAVLPVAAAEVRSTALLDLRLPAAPAPAPARVLICGDADFAYSRALAARLRHRAQIWTSCFEAEEALLQRYPHAGAAMAALRGARVDVRCGVDARALSSHYGAAARFDRIVFNLPQAPEEQGTRNQIQRHRALLRAFCASAAAHLAPGGELWITLLAGQGGTPLDPTPRPPGLTWRLPDAAARAGLLVRAVEAADAQALCDAGYAPTGRRTNQRLGAARRARGLVVHVLGREGDAPGPAAAPLEHCFHNACWATAPPPDPARLRARARAELGPRLSHALADVALVRTYEPGDGGRGLTYSFTYRTDRVALCRETAVAVNARMWQAVVRASEGLHADRPQSIMAVGQTVTQA